MRKFLRLFFSPFYKRYACHRIANDDKCSYKQLNVYVPKGVFHPLIFFSTKLLLAEVENTELKGKTVIDVGCGSGLIGMVAARKGAIVTLLDINPEAIAATKTNFKLNNLEGEILLSDLFSSVANRQFDFVFINPPYFNEDPKNFEEHAWFAGRQHEYFVKLFRQLTAYIHNASKVFMILSEDVDIHSIREIASENYFLVLEARSTVTWFEKNFIFKIVQQKR